MSTNQELLRSLPGVDHVLDLLEQSSAAASAPRSVAVRCVREVLSRLRDEILAAEGTDRVGPVSEDSIVSMVRDAIGAAMSFNLKHVVNATGVVIHTNLGRSLLPEKAAEHLTRIAGKYSNLEFDLLKGVRGSRYTAVEDILCELTGAEGAMVVNNNAGAVFLSLDTLARGREVIVSRGQLVEIGGSFRIPDVMARSGACLVEIGTTNRTHLADYEKAITEETALLLKVHTSNYSVVGFTSEVPLTELVPLGKRFDIPVMEDLGSGSFVDFSKYGLAKEPTVQEAIKAGVDVVTFSGDKMLGGPQAGIILGKKVFIEKIKKNPMNRALRIDKMTLAALEATLHIYREEQDAISSIPTLRMLTLPKQVIARRAKRLKKRLDNWEDSRLNILLLDGSSRVGGGALPLQDLPTTLVGIGIDKVSASALEQFMRGFDPPIVGRIEDDRFLIDLRTVQKGEEGFIENCLKAALSKLTNKR
ncbi:MAG: L-seryl-tRNA(Sec) selenium transferase [Deltaproteobacteria bacterium]|nr:L-seryl-tRNA(Sec) selenium transferase [Deltaproteobacteria bacterium]